jgi:restriction endonuclease S subunit
MTPEELKISIFHYAMQGKLVEQREEDGTANDLYSEIIKIAKKDKNITPITDDEIPFDIPSSWRWCKFGEIVDCSMGKTPPRAEAIWWDNDVPWVSISDMTDYGHIKETKEKVSKKAADEKFGDISKAGTLLMSFKLTVGRTSILDIDALHNEAIISICPYVDKNNYLRDYLFYILPIITQWGDSKNAIMGKTLNSKSIANLRIPLAPLNELHRIVAKIEELLPLVDRYAASYEKLEQFNAKFPEDMKKSILQYAIQGKLVEQRPEEGSAEELYKAIQEEKQKLIKEGKIKKEKPLAEITEDEIPFDISESWRWVRFAEFGSYKKGPFGSALTKSMFVPKGKDTIKVYEQKNAIQKDATLGEYYITKEYYEKSMTGFEVHSGDVIVSCAGTIGETFIMPDNIEKGIINQALMRMQLMPSVYKPYFLLFFDVVLKKNAIKSSKGSAIKNIPPFDELKAYLVPLPPLAEQHRIVAKIEELLPYCDRLVKRC